MYPNCWDQAAGGHVDSGHDYADTAIAELAEELGIQDPKLSQLGVYKFNTRSDDKIINQFVGVYVVRISSKTRLHPSRQEVGAVQWFAPDQLRRQIDAHRETFTPGFLHELELYFPDI